MVVPVKNDEFVRFGFVLDLSNYVMQSNAVQGSDDNVQMRLVAVVVHHGNSAAFGHYTAYRDASAGLMKNSPLWTSETKCESDWVHISDEKVTRVTEKEVNIPVAVLVLCDIRVTEKEKCHY
jgi:hypothetical protein